MDNLNDAFRYLHLPLPSDIARSVGMGDLQGAIALIDHRLASDISPELAARLTAERLRLIRTPIDFTLNREQAIAEVRKEWPDFSEAEFDQLFADAPEIKERCWLFRDFPGVTSTVNVLKRAEKSLYC